MVDADLETASLSGDHVRVVFESPGRHLLGDLFAADQEGVNAFGRHVNSPAGQSEWTRRSAILAAGLEVSICDLQFLNVTCENGNMKSSAIRGFVFLIAPGLARSHNGVNFRWLAFVIHLDLVYYCLPHYITAMTMDRAQPTQIRIQILDAKEEAGAVARAVGVVRDRVQDVAAIGRGQGAEALLVCPAPEEFRNDGIDLVIGARFGQELDDDAVFWRQRNLSREIRHELRVGALVLDLDLSLDDYVKSIEPMLAAPYRDELGRRSGRELPGVC